MRKCEYCAKELDSYHLQYCENTDCEEKALAFYDKRSKTEKIFGIINVVSMIAIMLGLFLDLFKPSLGNIIAAVGFFAMGVLVFVLPFGPDSFYKSYRIKKTTIIVRIVAAALLVVSAVFAVIAYRYALM